MYFLLDTNIYFATIPNTIEKSVGFIILFECQYERNVFFNKFSGYVVS